VGVFVCVTNVSTLFGQLCVWLCLLCLCFLYDFSTIYFVLFLYFSIKAIFVTCRNTQYIQYSLQPWGSRLCWVAYGYQIRSAIIDNTGNLSVNHSTITTCFFELLSSERPQRAGVSQQVTRCFIRMFKANRIYYTKRTNVSTKFTVPKFFYIYNILYISIFCTFLAGYGISLMWYLIFHREGFPSNGVLPLVGVLKKSQVCLLCL
jgi:hypothetical protein